VSRVRRLILSDFRNYAALDIAVDAPTVVLLGENGAGKTNLLEALSLFSPGRGLRRAEFAAMARTGGSGGFSVAAVIEGPNGGTRIGTGLDPGEDAQRRRRVDGATVASASAFAEHCRIVWLTPDNDALFRGPPGDRRRFLDRMVLTLDNAHGARVQALERALRTRNRLLDEPSPDRTWLDAVERELAEIGVAIAAARLEAVARLSALVAAAAPKDSPFPGARIELDGELERQLPSGASLAVEDAYRALLAENRWRDKAAGRTLVGPNTTDLRVWHGPKDIPAELASTGEQKALLIGLFLAHAELVRQMTGIAPLMLIDEAAAHLDARRRKALFDRLHALGGQVWLTGVDAAAFDGIEAPTVRYIVAEGRVVRAA
jgi:DNA replication and repair protein RecF